MLTAGQAQAVADLADKVADRYGRPQDIEWAIDPEGRLWLLAGPADDSAAGVGVVDGAGAGVVDA